MIGNPSRNSLAWAILLALAGLAPSARAQILPPPPAGLTMPTRLFVREFVFTGNRVFTSAELAGVTAPYTNRNVTSEELEDARRAVTTFYIAHGYINSGAVIPDQDPTNGIIRLNITEGVLTQVRIRDTHWLNDSYIQTQLKPWSGPPLDLNDLKEGLQVLRQNPNVTQVNAELKPGAAPGQAILDLRVTDQQPFRASVQVDNYRPPSVGAEEISVNAADINLTGHSDPLNLTYGIANDGVNDGWGFSGWDNFAGDYTAPLTRYNTTLSLRGSRDNSSIIEYPFNTLNISSETVDVGGTLRQPIYRTASREFALAVSFDWRQNKSTLFGQSFDVSPGSVNGEMNVSVLGVSQEFIDRGQNHVLALRSTFDLGLNVLDATDNGVSGDPNAKFFAWLGQGQYIQRLFNTQNQLILRVDGQWTDDRLLALQQISVGGHATVRGYLENQLVRDKGFSSSVEFRIPVLFDRAGNGIVQLAPFFDAGGAWNIGGTQDPTTICSVGTGILISPNKHINAELYWGYRLNYISLPDNNAQDLGLCFQVVVSAF